jgi:hypothetical protein
MKKLSVWDLLTVLTLIATLVLAIVMLSIFSNPDSDMNPFPKPTIIPTIFYPITHCHADLAAAYLDANTAHRSDDAPAFDALPDRNPVIATR